MLDILIKRRSVRKYKNKEVEEEKVDKLIKAVLLSPTSKNKCPWEFIIVKDKEILENLSKAKEKGILFLKGAPLAFVILGDDEISDVWIEDTSIAATIVQLTAESIGLSSCWSQIRERYYNSEKTAEKYVQEILNIPENKRVECIIGIGYPNEEKEPHNLDDLKYNKIYINKYK